jgi:hypothetical protein
MAKISTYASSTPADADKILGTDADATDATKNFLFSAVRTYIITSSVPASAGATGIAGQLAYDATHLYICVATDTWKRVAISTW